MPRAKRLAIIEDNNQDDTPQINNLLQNIRSTQHKLLKDIFKDILLLPPGTPIKSLIETFDKLIYSEILNSPINKIFDSLENVNQRFDKLLTDFKNAAQASGLAETYKPLCEGLELFIQWYRIQSIEAFLYKPLANEFAIKEDTIEEKISLQDRFDVLIKKINYFNSQVEEIEQGLEYYKPPTLDMKVTDLKEMLQPLLVEESRLNTLPNQAKVLKKLEQERLVLLRDLDDLQHEMERDIAACEASLVKAKEKREKLYDSALDIDVYYVDEFKKKYKEVFESYKKIITNNKQRDEFLRVEAIEKLIQNFSDCFRKFELSLDEYYSIHISTLYHTINSYLYYWVSSYYYSINGIYELLTQQFSAFKLNSAMLRLEAQYHEQYEYLRIGLPEVKKIVEESFVEAAKEYLREVEANDAPNKARISSQAKDAFDYDVLNQTLRIRPSKLIPTIKSLTSKALKRDKLNKNWDEIFHHIFTKELLVSKFY